MKTQIQRKDAKSAKAVRNIKAKPVADFEIQLKFARVVSALGDLVAAIEVMSETMVAREKFNRLPLRLRVSALKKKA